MTWKSNSFRKYKDIMMISTLFVMLIVRTPTTMFFCQEEILMTAISMYGIVGH